MFFKSETKASTLNTRSIAAKLFAVACFWAYRLCPGMSAFEDQDRDIRRFCTPCSSTDGDRGRNSGVDAAEDSTLDS